MVSELFPGLFFEPSSKLFFDFSAWIRLDQIYANFHLITLQRRHLNAYLSCWWVGVLARKVWKNTWRIIVRNSKNHHGKVVRSVCERVATHLYWPMYRAQLSPIQMERLICLNVRDVEENTEHTRGFVGSGSYGLLVEAARIHYTYLGAAKLNCLGTDTTFTVCALVNRIRLHHPGLMSRAARSIDSSRRYGRWTQWG